MKKAIILFLSIFVFYSCVDVKADKVDKVAIKTTINALLVTWHKAASDANFEDYFGKMDSTSIFIGTSAEEISNKTQL